MAETGGEYEAQSIVARRKHKGKVEYLVRWKGHTSVDDTWEQYAELPMAKHLIKQFLVNFRRGSTDSENSQMGPLGLRGRAASRRGGTKPSTHQPKNGPRKMSVEEMAKAGSSRSNRRFSPSDTRYNRTLASRPKRLAVVNRQRIVPTKVTDIAKKAVQRSTKTLQNVPHMNDLQVLSTSSRTRNSTVTGTSARQKLQVQAQAQLKGKATTVTSKSSKTVTRQRVPLSQAAKRSRCTAKKTARTSKSSKSSPPGSRGESSSSKSSPITAQRASRSSSAMLTPNAKSKKEPAMKRTAKSMSPQPRSKVTTGAGKSLASSRKRAVRQLDYCDSSSDDGDVLYSLASDAQLPKAKQAKVGSFRPATVLHRLLLTPGKTIKTDVEGSGTSRGSSMRGTPDSDPEISFKQLLTPRKRMLLKDSIKKSKKTVTTVPRSPSPLPTVASAAVAHSPSTATASSYKLSPSNSSQVPNEPNPAPVVDSMDDLPHIPVRPVLPSSPASASYKNLVKNISSNLQARPLKKKGSDSNGEAEPVVERRTSVRQSESAFRYKDIVVRKFPGYTQIWLFSQTKLKNAFNPKVFQELTQALHNAKFDDSRLVMLSGSGNIFSSGIDLHYLTSPLEDRRTSAKNMADAVREFASTLISFPKPIVAAVNGPAIGLGAVILPLCDIVYASDKASFYCPYARLCQTPECCSSYTFPHVMGMAVGNEMLLAGRKLTAIEAYENGLVSQVFWPTSMMQEVVPRVQNMAAFSAKSMEASKVLVRSHQRAKLQMTLETECQLLAERWPSSECQKAMLAYLEDEQDLLA